MSKVNTEDKDALIFHKNHGFMAPWDNVIESTYDLLRILDYCASDEMDYTPEAKVKIKDLHDWIDEAAGEEGRLTKARSGPT